jgi:hypothetical protein
MPTWFWVLFVVTFIVHAVIAFLMSPPEAVANWLVAKFELHPKLRSENAAVSVNGLTLDGEAKQEFIDDFNKAAFLHRYYDRIPNLDGSPAAVVTTRQGKQDVSFDLYPFEDHIDIIKRWNKKVVAYRVLSRGLQNRLLALTARGTADQVL